MTSIVEPHFESTSISAPLATYNPALIAEGYPGMPGYADPPKDNKHDSGQPSSSALAELSTEALAAGASRLPENDQAAFLDLLPQQDKVMLSNAAQQGQDSDSSVAALPKTDVVQALAQLPTDDVINAFTTQQGELRQGGIGGGDLYAASGLDQTPATVAQNADVAATNFAPGGQPGTDTTTGTANAQMRGADTTTGAVATPADTTNQVAPVGDATTTAAAPGAPATPGDTTNQAASAGDATGGAPPTAANADAPQGATSVKPEDLASALGHLPQVDLVSFEKALPANDQAALQAALAGNQNPSAADLANAFKQLPAHDVSAAALQVPDIAGYFSAGQTDSSHNEGSNWGGAALAVAGAAGAGGLLHLSQRGLKEREAADALARAQGAAARAAAIAKEQMPIAPEVGNSLVPVDGAAANINGALPLEARPAQLAITGAPEVGDIATTINTTVPDAGAAAQALDAAKAGAPEAGAVANAVTKVVSIAKDVPK